MRTTTFEQVSQYVMGLSSFRADDRDDWIKVGMAIHSFDSSDQGLSLWDRFSSQSGKYKEGECQQKWRGFTASKTKAVSVASLSMMFMQDTGGLRKQTQAPPQPIPPPPAQPAGKFWQSEAEAVQSFDRLPLASADPEAVALLENDYGITCIPSDWRIINHNGIKAIVYRGMTPDISPVFKSKTIQRFGDKGKRRQSYLYGSGGAIEFAPQTPTNIWCIVSGEEKALAASIAGLHSLSPLNGEHGLSEEWCKFLANEKPARIILANDNDDAGHKANKASAENLERFGIDPSTICIVDWSKFQAGYDLNDVAKQSYATLKNCLDNAKPFKPGVAPLDVWDIDRLFAHEDEETDNIVGDRIISAGELTLLVGPPDIGKSRVVNQLIFDLLLGTDFWLGSIPIHRHGMRVLLIQTENGIRRLKMDFGAQLRGVSLEERRLAAHNLKFHVPLTVEDRDLGLDDPLNIARLEKTVRAVQPDLVVMDPYGDMFAGDNENDAVQARRSVKAIFQVAQAHNPKTAILLIHHAKSGKAAAEGATGWDRQAYARGSKALMSIARSQINIAPGDAENSYLVVICGKNNNGLRFPTFAIELNQHSMLYERKIDFDEKQWEASLKPRGKSKTAAPTSSLIDPSMILCRLPEDGSEVQRTALTKDIAETHGLNERTLQEYIRKMVQNGEIQCREEGNGSYRRHFLSRKPD